MIVRPQQAADYEAIRTPRYYGRFGFRPAQELGVLPPEPRWGEAFQARPLTAYTRAVAGQFRYAPAFLS
jgi:putative acetyltransferase